MLALEGASGVGDQAIGGGGGVGVGLGRLDEGVQIASCKKIDGEVLGGGD